MGYNFESESLLPSVETENGWHARAVALDSSEVRCMTKDYYYVGLNKIKTQHFYSLISIPEVHTEGSRKQQVQKEMHEIQT